MRKTIKKEEDKRQENIKLYFEKQLKIEQNVVMKSVDRQNRGREKLKKIDESYLNTVENRKAKPTQ